MKSLLLVLLPLLVGCMRELPPHDVPPRTVPPLDVDPGPVPSGAGRVILDGVDGPARVYVERAAAEATRRLHFVVHYRDRTENEHLDIHASATVLEPLCKTPCAADLPTGTYRLHFEPDAVPDRSAIDRDVADITVEQTPTVYRRAVGTIPSYRSVVGHGIIVTSWITAGLAIAGGGVAVLTSDDSARDRIAGTMIGLGVVAVASGIIYAIIARPNFRQGASVQFAVPR